MRINTEWTDFEVIATGGGEKLERWGSVYLLRPDPQVIWKSGVPLKDFPKLNAHYQRSETGGGQWEYLRKTPDNWTVKWRNLVFEVKPMGFKHTGLFPEQAVNWAAMIDLIKKADRPVSVLNLFAYTGGATAACVSAGASVCHVDSAKNMVERAKENLCLSGLPFDQVRFIVDDCKKFVLREIKRGKKYDAIVMDPPSYGRGSNGEIWKLEDDLADFLEICSQVISENPLFVLLNSYTTGLQPAVLNNMVSLAFKKFKGRTESYEVGLPTNEGITLPCGASAFCSFER